MILLSRQGNIPNVYEYDTSLIRFSYSTDDKGHNQTQQLLNPNQKYHLSSIGAM